MSHSLENIEYHQFKYAWHKIPLLAHIHFFGADAFSYGNGIKLQEGDLMRIQWNEMEEHCRIQLRFHKRKKNWSLLKHFYSSISITAFIINDSIAG
jgi:hypothetical protein